MFKKNYQFRCDNNYNLTKMNVQTGYLKKNKIHIILKKVDGKQILLLNLNFKIVFPNSEDYK